jgi:hypothetical protein
MFDSRAVLLLLGTALLVACAEAPAKPTQKNPVVARAAFDLACAPQAVVWYQLGNNTWGARGCGRQATYLYRCHNRISTSALFPDLVEDCEWFLDSSIQAVSTPRL